MAIYSVPSPNSIIASPHCFIGAHSPLSSCDIRPVLGNFLPQDPYIFFVAHGRVDKPFLYVKAFQLCMTVGPLLRHEKNFSFFRARTIIRGVGCWFSPLFTLIIPHYLGFPVGPPPMLRKFYQWSARAGLADLYLPTVEIEPQGDSVWRRDVAIVHPCTGVQAAMGVRLEQSWAKYEVTKRERKQ